MTPHLAVVDEAPPQLLCSSCAVARSDAGEARQAHASLHALAHVLHGCAVGPLGCHSEALVAYTTDAQRVGGAVGDLETSHAVALDGDLASLEVESRLLAQGAVTLRLCHHLKGEHNDRKAKLQKGQVLAMLENACWKALATRWEDLQSILPGERTWLGARLSGASPV